MPKVEDYTVGWICPSTEDMVSASVVLDEEHEELESKPINDTNSYVLGRIGQHNVVIAPLPNNARGPNEAGGVLQHMLRSFPNIQVGLLVSTGGGAPAKHDIRLGDVVVSKLGNNHMGVLQYDYDATIKRYTFLYNKILTNLSLQILSDVDNLRVSHIRKGHKYNQSIASVLERFPRIQKEYQQPDASTDRLYKPDVLHKDERNKGCAQSCGDDESKFIFRDARPAEQDSPVIHYGLVGSAPILGSSSRPMEDALIRDQLSEERDVLCFQTEAAGVGSGRVGVLVICGICNYSDGHKYPQWQGYAAMTAATYARDFVIEMRDSSRIPGVITT